MMASSECGYDHCQRGYAEARAAVPELQGAPTNATVPCQFENAQLQAAFFENNLESGENAGVDSWWTDGTCDGGTYGGDWYETRTHKPVPTSPAFSCTCTP